MAQQAALFLDGVRSDLKYFRYQFERYTEENGKPSTRVRKGQIEIMKDSIYNKGVFTEWMSQPDKHKDGHLIIYDGADLATAKEWKKIEFTHGFVVSYEETFSLDSGVDATRTTKNNTTERLVISCETMTVSGAKFDFIWPEFHL
jgi:hypothetical protein